MRSHLRTWMQRVYDDLGIQCTVPLPPDLSAVTLNALATFGFRIFLIPELAEKAYSKGFVLPWWFGGAERVPLKSKWVAMESIAKPELHAPYSDDTLGRALGLQTRFGVSWDTLKQKGLLAQAASLLHLSAHSVRLSTAEEWNFLANLFIWLARERKEALPDLGATNSWEWVENGYGPVHRLLVGRRERGGVQAINSCWCGHEHGDIGFRVLAVLEPKA